ncbi:MAG: translation elongation factor Ts [Chloroflexi bacterium]|nr:translation elongation factor Ts [Chloroflexota bacterium]
MAVPATSVKALRELTGAGILDCKKALEDANGDMDRAVEILRQAGYAAAAKKTGRQALEGLVEAYIHPGGRIGAMVEVNCETDFVARTSEFQALAHDLAMQVAALSPRWLSEEELPDGAGDPQELCLLAQPFIKDPAITVRELITSKIAVVRENIRVRRFVRFELAQ